MPQQYKRRAAQVKDALNYADLKAALFENYVAGRLKPGDSLEDFAVAALNGKGSGIFIEPDDRTLRRGYRDIISRSFSDTDKRFRPNSSMPGLSKRTESYVIAHFELFKKTIGCAPVFYDSEAPRYLGDKAAYDKLTSSLLCAVVDGRIRKNGSVKLTRKCLCVIRFAGEVEALFNREGNKLTLLNNDIESELFLLAFFSCLRFQNSGNSRIFLQKLKGAISS